MHIDYDPRAKVVTLERDFGENALHVLEAFNLIDPFHCYYGDDVNPDEYAGYARRFMYHISHEEPLVAAVRKSFWDSQLKDKWVTDEQIEQITNLISENDCTP